MLWFVAFALALGVMLHLSNIGNWIYATGGHPQAAADMGIDTRRVKLFAFMLCSFLAGFAGMITTFRLKSALPSLGEGLELQAIAAAVIGGTALRGGIGSVLGFIIGAGLIRVIDNGLVMARIDANWFRFAIGGLTIVAVILNTWLRLRARRIKA
jgi:simple sugar transport system permease protein